MKTFLSFFFFVFLEFVYSKVNEEELIKDSENYFINDKIMRLRKRNKKFIEFMDELLQSNNATQQQMQIFTKIQNYTQFISDHNLQNNFDYQDLNDKIHLMELKIKKQKPVRVRRKMQKFNFNVANDSANSNIMQSQQQIQNSSNSLKQQTDNFQQQTDSSKQQTDQPSQQIQSKPQQSTNNALKKIIEQGSKALKVIDKQNLLDDIKKLEESNNKLQIQVQNDNQQEQEQEKNEQENKSQIEDNSNSSVEDSNSDSKSKTKTNQEENNNEQNNNEESKVSQEQNQLKINEEENEIKNNKDQIQGLQLKIESLVNYQLMNKQNNIQDLISKRLISQKNNLDRQLQTDISDYQMNQQQREENISLILIKQVLNNTNSLNEIQQQEIRNNNNSLLIQKILNDLIKSEQLKNEVVTTKVNQLVQQIGEFKSVLEINKKLKHQISQMKLEQAVMLENLKRQSDYQDYQQNALKILAKKVTQYQQQLYNKSSKIDKLNQQIYEKSANFVNESLATQKSKYIINKLSFNILKDYLQNNTQNLINNYMTTLKFVKGMFLQQKSTDIEQVQTLQEYIQNVEDYYDEKMILNGTNICDQKMLLKMVNDLIDFINLVPFCQQLKFLPRQLKKQFNDIFQPFMKEKEVKEQQKLVEALGQVDDGVGIDEMMTDLQLDVEHNTIQTNEIQNDLVRFLKQQQIELHQ